MPEQQLNPDKSEIRRDLEHMTARWSELSEPAMLEIRAFAEGKQPQILKYSPDWLDDAVDAIADMNARGRNVYVVRNPISANCKGSATDDDIIASFFLWADCDDAASAGNIKRFDGPKYSAAVTTGRTPETRVHIYWRLEQPCTDMAAWRDMQTRIAAHFGSDRSVINPSRIMRVAGTVSWPDSKKRSKGYINELVTLRTEYKDARPPVTLDQMGRVFGAGKTGEKTGGANSSPNIDIDTGPQPLDRALAAANIAADKDWRNNVKSLVASYVARGWSDEEILARCDSFTLAGYTVEDTRKDVASFIEWTRVQEARHGGQYAVSPDRQSEGWAGDAPDEEEANWPTPLTEFNELALPRREWVYGNSYIRSYVSVMAAAGGVGKTSLGIVEALAIATGRPLLGEIVKEPCKVWVINLEDPRSEMLMRTLAAMKRYGLTEKDVAGNLFIDGEDDLRITLATEGRDGLKLNTALLQHMQAKILENQIGVVIVDPFVSTHHVNENSNASIQAVVSMFRELARQTRAAVMLVHHTRKGNGEDANVDSVRGAGSLIGAARSARVVNHVSKDDAEKLGVTSADAVGLFRVDDGKANLSPRAEDALYRRMVGVELANGEWVGVAVPFELPDEWSGMTEEVINDILRLIDKGPVRETGDEEYYSIRVQDKARWVGQVIMDYPFRRAEDFKSEAQAKLIIRQWQKTGLIEEIEYYSTAQRKPKKGVSSTGRVGVQK